MKKIKTRNNKASSIAEAAASLVVMIPLMMLLIFVTLEVSYACFLINNLSQAARTAARSLSIAYGANPEVASSRILQDQMVFDNIRLSNIVNDSSQFDDPVFQTNTDPKTVTVILRYASNQYSLPLFPYPDPLNLNNRFQPIAQSTYRLE